MLLIDSRDRITGTSESFKVNLKPAIYNIKSIDLVNCSIPNTIYNIDSTNNVIYFYDVSSKTCLIPSGNYTIDTILTAITTSINAASTLVWTVTYDTTTMKMTFATPSNSRLMFSNTTNTAATILGYSNSDTASATSHIASNVINLAGDPNIYITINEFGQQIVTSNNQRFTFVLQNDTITGDVVEWTNEYQQCTGLSNILQTLTVSLQKRDGSLVSLNGSEWSLLLRIN